MKNLNIQDLFVVDAGEECSEEEEDEDVVGDEELRQKFPHNYCVQQSQAAALNHTYCTHLHPDTSETKIAAGLSDNSVSIYSLERLSLETSIAAHESPLCRIKFSESQNKLLYTGSEDGYIKLWDLRTDTTTPVAKFSDSSDEGQIKPLRSFDVDSSDRVLCAGSELIINDAFLLFWDIRHHKSLGGYWQSHSDDINMVSFNGGVSNKLCSGSDDGLVNIFDINACNEDDALLYSLNVELSVDACIWSGDSLLTVITQEGSVQCWEEDSHAPTKTFTTQDIATVMQRKCGSCCYTVNCHKRSDDQLLVAASHSNNSGCMRLLRLHEGELSGFALFDAVSHSGSVVRASCLLQQSNMLVTGGESGIIDVWQPGHSTPSPHKFKEKAKKKTKSKPY